MSDQDSNSDRDDFIYEDSTSEVEEWDEDIHWAVRDVDGEYQPPRGPRYLKFDWEQWKRVDDTSHTWEREGGVATQDAPRTIRQFDSKRAREESISAKDPLVIPYSARRIPASADDENEGDSEHNNNKTVVGPKSKKRRFAYLFTEIPQQANELFVDAKLKQIDRRPSAYSEALPLAENLLARLRQARQRQFDDLGIDINIAFVDNLLGFGRAALPSEANRVRVKTQKNMQERMSNLKIKETTLPSQKNVPPIPPSPPLLPSPSPPPPPPPAPPAVARRSISIPRASTSTTVITSIRPSQSTIVMTPQPLYSTLRAILQSTWARIVQRAHAAPITLANEVNEEEIPPISINTFQYLETAYIYSDGIPRPDPNFLHSCDCPAGACEPNTCACQEDSMIFDNDDNKRFMYNSKGLFMFDLNVSSYVFECNEKCSCGPSCPSRVAQKPRKIPIEVFRTVECGWGVRSPVDIPKGTVLGLYTGTLLKRRTARNIPAEDARYLCDLDFHDDVRGSDEGYTVNANTSGNWTRFVNHSCDPLCKLYAVIYDSVPEIHQPKLALVAKKHILAFTQITLDYNPTYNRRGKGKQKVTDDSLECHCGSDDCRGYIYVS